MKIIYSQQLALSIVLAGVIARRNPEVEIAERDNASLDNLIEAFQTLYPKEQVQNLGITAILHSDTPRSRRVKLALVALHHDLTQVDNLHTAHSLYQGDKKVIEHVEYKGAIIEQYLDSEHFRLLSQTAPKNPEDQVETILPTEPPVELRKVTEETLELNPELKELGVEFGETIGVTPKSDVPEPTPEPAPKKAGRRKKDA